MVTNVVASDIADNAITSAKINDDSIVNADINSAAAIDFTKLSISKDNITGLGIPGSDTDTTYTNGTGLNLTDTVFSIDSTVVTSNFAGTITATAFSGSGALVTNVVASDIDDNAITSAKINDDSIVNADINSEAAIDFTKLSISKDNITGLGIPGSDTDTTYSNGTGLNLTDTVFSIDSTVVTSNYTGTITATAFSGSGALVTNVVASDIDDNAITSAKIDDDSIVNADIKSDAAIVFSKLSISKDNITGLGIPGSDTTYSAETGLSLTDTVFSIDSTVVTSNYEGTITANYMSAKRWIPNATGGSVFIGMDAGAVDDLDGNKNIFIGEESGKAHVSGGQNSFVGYRSGFADTTGHNNLFMGAQSGYSNTEGDGNIFLGYQAGYNETGSNKLYIDNSNTASPLIYGDFSTNGVTINGTLSATGIITGDGSGLTNLSVTIPDNSITGAKIAIGSDAQGDIMYYDGTDWVRLAAGTSGYVLQTQGSSANPIWALDAGTAYTAGTGLTLNATVFSIDSTVVTADYAGTITANYISAKRWIPNGIGDSIFIGNNSGINDDLVASDNRNMFIGTEAGYSNTTGYNNSFMGYQSGYTNGIGWSNSFIGYQSGYSNYQGRDGVFIGYQSGYSNTSGHNNSFMGYQSGYSNTSGGENSFMGKQSGYSNTTGAQNTFIGYKSGDSNTEGGYNSFMGSQSGKSNTTGSYNSFFGNSAGNANTTATSNLFLGAYAGAENTTGARNVFLGYKAGYNETGSDKLYIENSNSSSPLIYGDFSADAVTINGGLSVAGTVTANYFVGDGSGLTGIAAGIATSIADTDGDTNIQVEKTANDDTIRFTVLDTEIFTITTTGITFPGPIHIGAGSAYNSATTGADSNIFIGINSGYTNVNGEDNTFLGNSSGYNNEDGDYNTFVGSLSGSSNTGSYNIFLGYSAGAYESGSNKLYIENSNSSSPLIYGDFSADAVTINGGLSVAGTVTADNFVGDGSGLTSVSATIADNSITGAKIALGSDVQGDIMYYNGTDWVRLAATSSGYVLQTQGPGANPVWAADADTTYTNGSGLELSGITFSIDSSVVTNNYAGGIVATSFTGSGVGLTGVKSLSDADSDTNIQIEEGSDDDTIRFDVAGTEAFTMVGNRLEFLNSGSSVFIGNDAGAVDDLSSNKNVFIGEESGKANTSGYNNTFIGYQTGILNIGDGTKGGNNVFIGYKSGAANVTGNTNVYIGSQSGDANEGQANTFIGYESGGSTLTGSRNVFIGHKAGKLETGSDKLYIANSGDTTPLIYGEFDTLQVVISGNASDNGNDRTFFFNGSAGGTGAWNNDSDRRLKTNIETIQNPLEKVLSMRGVRYEWKDTSNHELGYHLGFIAQEVEPILPEVVTTPKTDDAHYSMQYAPITAVLVEAIKEQQKQINDLMEKNRELEDKLNKVLEQL